MRIIIMGTGPFALPSCRRLVAEGHSVPLVVTRPPATPETKKPPDRPVYRWAQELGLPIYEPPSINAPAAVARLAEAQAELFFVCDYGQILSQECLAASRLGGINLHGSLLPRHRGAAPVQWTLLSGDQEAGVSVIHMTPRLDAGPTLAVARTDVRPDETAAELEPRLAELGVAATVAAVELLSQWDGLSPLGEFQDARLATRAPRLAKSDGQLDFRMPAIQLERQIRACQPWPGTYAELRWPNGKQLRLLIRAGRGIASTIDQLASASPGTVISLKAQELGVHGSEHADWSAPWDLLLAVAAGQPELCGGTLLISRVQPAGKREMSADEFLRGHPIGTGVHFALP